jgi:hypothetical protein
MGEYADEEILRGIYEWLDHDYSDEYDDADFFAEPPRCKFCNRVGNWVNLGTEKEPKWRLYERGKPHVCNVRFKHHANNT